MMRFMPHGRCGCHIGMMVTEFLIDRQSLLSTPSFSLSLPILNLKFISRTPLCVCVCIAMTRVLTPNGPSAPSREFLLLSCDLRFWRSISTKGYSVFFYDASAANLHFDAVALFQHAAKSSFWSRPEASLYFHWRISDTSALQSSQ